MDQRTLLAVVLSLFVLMAFNSMLMKPAAPPLPQNINNTQPIENKQVNNISYQKSAVPSASSLSNEIPEKSLILSETVDTESLTAILSNLGGTIKSLTLKKYNHVLPITDILSIDGFENKIFTVNRTANTITFSYADNEISVTKNYEFTDSDLILADMRTTNLNKMSKLDIIKIENFKIDATLLDEKAQNNQDKSLFEYSADIDGNIYRKGNAYSFSLKEARNKIGRVNWVGFRDRYFCVVVHQNDSPNEYSFEPLGDKAIKLSTKFSSKEIPPGGSVSYSYTIYAGPQNHDAMRKYNIGIEEIISFSNIGILDAISKGIVSLTKIMHRIIPNFGICIILVSALIYFALYPLSIRGMMSMKKMQALQPKIGQLKEKYKDNAQKLNAEIMALYKTNRINPIGGCLPLILQMPVFIGLYQALWRSFIFNGADFLWIKDLSAPDRLFTFSSYIPVIGNEFNILPILMMIIMFFQQKLSMMSTTIPDPNMATQQKFMVVFFPLFLGFIFYKFSSGLNLYFTVFYALSSITQWKIYKTNIA